MSWDLYVRLSVMMFLEFAVWGAWAPVLAARLLGPLKMSGKQTGWIYATLPLGCIISPLVAGQLADKYLNTEWILAGAHLLGAVLLLVAVTQRKFGGLFVVMLLYSLCYAATLPLVNSLMFGHLGKVVAADRIEAEAGKVFIMAPIAWALVGYFLTGVRQLHRQEGDGRDCLIMAGVLSVLMGIACLFLPETRPPATGKIPVLEALGMLRDPNFLVFIVISAVVAGLMQFYFLGTAQFMQDRGIPGRNVPAAMGVAQAAQALATLFALGALIDQLGYKWDLVSLVGYKWTLTVGAACWLLLYAIYVGLRSRWAIVLGQALHGMAYVTFIIAGQIYASKYAPKDIGGSVQALYFAAALGVGLFVFTQMAGLVMDRFSAEGKFQWRAIWTVPLVIMALGVLALIVAFQGTLPPRP